MPVGGDAKALQPVIADLRAAAAAAGKRAPEVVVLVPLPLDDPPRAAAQAHDLHQAGATRLVHMWRYPNAAAFARAAEIMTVQVRSGLTRR